MVPDDEDGHSISSSLRLVNQRDLKDCNITWMENWITGRLFVQISHFHKTMQAKSNHKSVVCLSPNVQHVLFMDGITLA